MYETSAVGQLTFCLPYSFAYSDSCGRWSTSERRNGLVLGRQCMVLREYSPTQMHTRVEAGSSINSGLCVFIAVGYVNVHCEHSGET